MCKKDLYILLGAHYLSQLSSQWHNDQHCYGGGADLDGYCISGIFRQADTDRPSLRPHRSEPLPPKEGFPKVPSRGWATIIGNGGSASRVQRHTGPSPHVSTIPPQVQ